MVRCPDCGHVNPEGGRFCNQCGAPLSSASQTLASQVADDEEIRFVLRPSLIFVITRYIVSAVLTLAAGGIYWYIDQLHRNTLPWWSVLLVAVIVFIPAIYRHILRQREIYTLTNHKIEFTYGLVAKLRRNIPLGNVQDVTVTQSMAERLLGIGDIVIDSAAQTGKIPLRNIHQPEKYADMILREIQWHQR
jgi:membrane protein YdbS with pleckstrin-like domain